MSDELRAAAERRRRYLLFRLNAGSDNPYLIQTDEGCEFDDVLAGSDDGLLADAYLADHAADEINWYCKDEIYHWLKRMNYSEEIANELAGIVAANHQLAFNKGVEIGKRSKESS